MMGLGEPERSMTICPPMASFDRVNPVNDPMNIQNERQQVGELPAGPAELIKKEFLAWCQLILIRCIRSRHRSWVSQSRRFLLKGMSAGDLPEIISRRGLVVSFTGARSKTFSSQKARYG